MRPTALNYVTCPFGRKGAWAAGYHTGTDYRAAVGTPIYPTKGGKVEFAGEGGWGPAYGKQVIIRSRHKGKEVKHLYAHLSQINVRAGQRVKTGQVIGRAGETGNTFGAHLHYEERVFPFGYYDHRRPQLSAWTPKRKRVLRVLRKLGVIKKK